MSTSPSRIQEKLGPFLVDLLSTANRVESFLIEDEPIEFGQQTIDNYPITAAGPEKGRPFARELATALLQEPMLYGESARCFLPRIAFRLWKNQTSVDILICFECTNLVYTLRNAAGDQVGEPINAAFGPHPVSDHTRPLLKLVGQVFPDDDDLAPLVKAAGAY